MAGGGSEVVSGRCPRCEICGRAVRVRGVGREGVWCLGCIGGALPFVGLVGEGEFRGALRDYRAGLGSRAGEFLGLMMRCHPEGVRWGVLMARWLVSLHFYGGLTPT